MAARKRAIKPMTDPDNILGKAYGAVLRQRAQLLRTGLIPGTDIKRQIAVDLDTLAWLAENMPTVFAGIPKAKD